MTALVIIITGMHTNTEGYGGIELTSKAFGKKTYHGFLMY